MKKIFFILLKKWTASENQTKSIVKPPQYYPRDLNEPLITVENLTDVPPVMKYF